MIRRLAALCLALHVAEASAATPGAASPGPAYLAYAGPQSSSPASAFGHLFLVLAAREDQPVPLWDAVTFLADTGDAGPLRYMVQGVAGGFDGQFSRLPFHESSREYELLEDRELWLVELRLTAAERLALEQALAAEAGRSYPYTFFQLNCAFYLQRVLARTTGAVPEPWGIVSPAGVMNALLASRLAGPSFHRASASRRIAELARGMDPRVTDRLADRDWYAVAADLAFLEGLSPAERRLAQEVFALRAIRETSALPPSTQAGLARLRLLLAAAPGAPAPPPPAAREPGVPLAALELPRYGRLRLSGRSGGPGGARVALELRGAMHDDRDPWLGAPQPATMTLLAAEVSATPLASQVRLESATLFSQRALHPWTALRRRPSWLVEAIARRGGLLSADGVHIELRGGAGATWRLPAGVYVHALATAAAVGEWHRGAAPAPGVEAGLSGLGLERFRFGLRAAREHDALAWSRHVERWVAWARLDVGAHAGVSAVAERSRGRSVVSLGLEWYP